MVNAMNHSLALIVTSCDKYSDMWYIMFDMLFKHWPDCPYQVYLISNRKKFDHPRVTTLLSGDDTDWSSSIRRAIAPLAHDYYMFLMDDAFINQGVDTNWISNTFEWGVNKNFSFMRMRPNPPPARWDHGEYGTINAEDAYRVSIFSTIWKASVFNEILTDGESAWEFETCGTLRSKHYDGFYAANFSPFPCIHGVERGVWIRPSARMIESLGYKIDYEKRPLMGFKDALLLRYRLFKSKIYNKIPSKYRTRVMKIIQFIYKKVGLR